MLKGWSQKELVPYILAYEQLKEKLEKEGLFNLQHKKKIPTYPDVSVL